MLRRPPTSTLFPYRRSSDLAAASRRAGHLSPHGAPPADVGDGGRRRIGASCAAPVHVPEGCAGLVRSAASAWRWCRSEEHTSELQSLTNLVCRLLLEKKKTI